MVKIVIYLILCGGPDCSCCEKPSLPVPSKVTPACCACCKNCKCPICKCEAKHVR